MIFHVHSSGNYLSWQYCKRMVSTKLKISPWYIYITRIYFTCFKLVLVSTHSQQRTMPYHHHLDHLKDLHRLHLGKSGSCQIKYCICSFIICPCLFFSTGGPQWSADFSPSRQKQSYVSLSFLNEWIIII